MSKRTAEEERKRRSQAMAQHKPSAHKKQEPKQTQTVSKPKQTSRPVQTQSPVRQQTRQPNYGSRGGRSTAPRSEQQSHKQFSGSRSIVHTQTRSEPQANTRTDHGRVVQTFGQRPTAGQQRAQQQSHKRFTERREQSEVARNVGRAAKLGAQDVKSGWEQTIRELPERAGVSATDKSSLQVQAMRMGKDPNDKKTLAHLESIRKNEAEENRKRRIKSYEESQERHQKFNEETKDASSFEKALYSATESGVGMAADIGVGLGLSALTGGSGSLASLSAMGMRLHGQARGEAEANGATEKEATRYADMQTAKELGTETLFRGIGFAKGYGKGALPLADKISNKLTGNLTGKAADIVGAGAKHAGGMLEEAAEEWIGYGLDPVINEYGYRGNVRRRVRDSIRAESDELRARITDENTARAAATYLGSDDFIEKNKQNYMAMGISEQRSTVLAGKMREYLTASLTGDTDEMKRLEKEMSEDVAGKGLSLKSWDPGELLETTQSILLLTGVTGLPGTVRSAAQGAQIKESLGDKGIKGLARTEVDFEDREMHEKAKAIESIIESGKNITDTQAFELAQAVKQQTQKDARRQDASRNTAQREIRDRKLVSPYTEDETGKLNFGEVTSRTLSVDTEAAQTTIKAINNENKGDTRYHLDAKQVKFGAKAIAAFQSGVMNIDDVNAFTYYNNKVVRQAFEETTGIDLDKYVVRKRNGEVDIPATNTKTKDALFVLASENLVKAAEAETENWMNYRKGEVVSSISARMGGKGTVALQQALDDVDERNQSEYMLHANAADYLYQSARNLGTEWNTIKEEAKAMFPEISESKLENMYNAGLEDRADAEDTMRNRAVVAGQPMSEMGEQETATGDVIIETKEPVQGTIVRTFSEIAQNLGADIHLVDYIKNVDGDAIDGANGAYDPKTNTFYLNVSTGIEKNVGYIFMHEATHYLKTHAPEQYQKLENLVREKWFAMDPEQMQTAIARKIEAYRTATKGRQVLTEEQALEEIIADAAHEFITDPHFAEQVAEDDPTLAKTIINSIREVLRKLRRIFASGNVTDETHMNSLFSELDILTEAEALWLDAYKTAVRNKASADIDAWQDEVNGVEENQIRHSVTTENKSLPKGGSIPNSLKKWAKDIGLDTISKQPVKSPVIVSVKDLRSAWYEKNGRSEEAETINKALKAVGDSLTDLVGEYQYIDLGDALNATVHYRTDSEGNPTSVILSCQVKNAEYEVNFDFTTICSKRTAMQKVLEKFIKTEGEHKDTLYDELKLDEEGMYKLRLILEQAGFEVACRGCFVEQNRYSQQNQAKTVADDWNAALDAWAEENGVEITDNFGLTTLDINALDYDEIDRGFEKYHELMTGVRATVENKNRALIESSPFFRKRMNSSDYASLSGQRALMAIGESKKDGTNLYGLLKRGQSDSKQSVPFVAYNGEVALLPDKMKGKALRDYLISIGGARGQSASDFQIEFVYDYMQLVADLAARDLPMHMYTKVIELAELFGMTGIKINLSAMCDVDENLTGEYAGLKLVDGKYEYNISDQSIDYQKAVELQKKDGYSKNIGIIMVVLSKEHMLKSLDDSDVRYIIGYHSSAMPVVVANMSNMGDATDYTKLNKTSQLTDKGKTLFAASMEEAKGKTELDKFKDALRIFEDKIQEDVSTKKKKPRRGNEYGSYMKPYKANTADFNTYDDLQNTNDARKTADNYIEYCMKNDLIPMYFPFAYHENYYKCEVYDFNMYDNVTGEYAPMQGVKNVYPGLNMDAGETDASKFMDRVSEMMNVRNDFEEKQAPMYESVIEQAKEELKYSITGNDYMDFDESGIDHSELMHRADAPKTEAQERDDTYMDAVDRGDMDEAQRLVDEAAKTAGMNTPKLYHGTRAFGFTEFDNTKLDDGFSIFATNNRMTAETYSGETDRSLISEASNINVDDLRGEELLSEARKSRKKYNDYRIMSEDEKSSRLEESKNDVRHFASVLNNFVEENRESFTGEKMEIVNRMVDSLNRISEASYNADPIMALSDFQNAMWELKWEDEDLQLELSNKLNEEGNLEIATKEIDDFMYSGDIFVNKDYATDYVFDNQLSLELDADLHKGVYGLYGKPGKQLVIDANGENWNAITPPESLGLYGPQKTRWIASAAKEKGYDSVLFKNLRDNGGETAYNGTSDVYIFFDRSQLKSADPVTYAEDGSVIPLSERFDPDNNDIRYSLPTEDSDGNILTDGQMEYFKNSQARDENGRLVPVYHVTRLAGFTVFDPSYSYDKTSLSFSNDVDFALYYSSDDGNPDDAMTAFQNRYGMEEVESDFDNEAIGHYKVYLNMTNPLILDADAFDERDIYEWPAYAKEQGYDGIIHKDFEESGADIYQVFSGNQIKDTRNENPTDDPDIRFSIPSNIEVRDSISQRAEDIDDIPLQDNLLEENRVRYSISKETFINSVKSRWNERWEELDDIPQDIPKAEKSLRMIMKEVRKNSGTVRQYKSDTLKEVLKDVKRMHRLSRSKDVEGFAKLAWETAEKIVDDIDYNDDLYVKYSGIRKYFDKTRIAVPEELMYDDDFVEFAREQQGSIRLSSEGTSIENAYRYLSKRYSDMFPNDIEDPIDQLMQMTSVLDYTTPYREVYSSEAYSDLVEDVANNLCSLVEDSKGYNTTIEKLKVDAMNQRHQEALRKVTQKYEQKLSDIDQRHQEELRKADEKLEQVREHGAEQTEKQRQRANMWKERYHERIQQNVQERKDRKERQMHKKAFDKISENYNELCRWVLDPTKEKNVPEPFRKTLAEFLQTLDLQTENSKKLEEKTGHAAYKTLHMRELKDRLKALAESKAGVDGSFVSAGFELDAYAAYFLDKLSDDYEGKPVDELTPEAISDLNKLLNTIMHNIKRYKQVKKMDKMTDLNEIGSRSVVYFKKKIDRDGVYGKREGALGAFDAINTSALTPAHLFDRLGPLKEMYDTLRYNGFDTYIRNEKMIIDTLSGILGKYNNTDRKGRGKPGSQIEKWRNDSEAVTVELASGQTVTMSVAQVMSLYCLYKRGTQALDHMLVGGIVVTPIQTGSKIQAAKEKLGVKRKHDTSEKYKLAYEDIQNIISNLTEDQKKVADQLQELMYTEMAKLGNEAHVELYGYEMFNEENYFPIKVHGNELPTDINNVGEAIEKIKSFGPAKPLTPRAGQAIEIGDIFSIVAEHCNGMNLYNAYLVPLSDMMKVLNYTHVFENGETLTMKEAITQAYGSDILEYIMNLMKDLNGIKGDNRGGLEGIINKALGKAKRAAVFGNIRVALQQPTAIIRAATEISPKYLMKALASVKNAKGLVPGATTDAMREMWKYCPIAQWKAWGYYDTYMGRDIEDVMMNTYSIKDTLLAGYYGQLDNVTWSIIWQATKAEQAEQHPDMDPKSEEFLELCGRRASEIFDRSQVVDSAFHRSDAMRSNQVATKLFTAFMAEPTLTLNVFRAGLFNAAEKMRSGDKAAAVGIVSKTISVIVAQALLVAAAQAVADAWRDKDPGLPWDDDDDDDKEKADFFIRWLHNFTYNTIDQLHLERNMYLVKDVTPYIDYMMSMTADHFNWPSWFRAVMGWDQDYLGSQNNLIFAGLENTAHGVGQFFKKLEKGDDYKDPNTGEPRKWYDIIQKIMSGVGTFTGIPVGTLMRDGKPIVQELIPAVYASDSNLMEAITRRFRSDDSSGGGSGEGSGDDRESKIEAYRNSLSDDYTDEQKKKLVKQYEKTLDAEAGPAEKADDKEDFDYQMEMRSLKAAEKASGKTGAERDAALWDVIGDGYSKYVEAADMESLDTMKEIFVANGGKEEYFDKKIVDKMKSSYKKTIFSNDVDDPEALDRQQTMKQYMTTHGVTDEEISDMCYHSYTARDLKAALRMNNEEYIMDELVPLVRAGLTRSDWEKLVKNMNYGAKTYDGKYSSDEYKGSTGTFVWPAQGPITSEFGYRNAPTAGASSNHPAIDIGASQGSPVVAADGGTVISAGNAGGYGNQVAIQHENGMVTYYSHLYSWNVKVGDTVSQGQQVGQVGSTGISTGPHLDFKVEVNGEPVNPLEYLSD